MSRAKGVIAREFDSREAWMVWRLGRATGSTIGKMIAKRGDGIKEGIWRAAAESIIGSAAIAEADLTAQQTMDRGHELEPFAIERFEQETGKKVSHKLVGWEHPDDSRIAVSPDGVIGKTEAVEVKCLLSPKHVEALYTRQIPKNTAGYEEQRLWYYIANPQLKKVHHLFYHPDFPKPLDFFILTSTRKELKDQIDALAASGRDAVAKIREIVNAVSLYTPEEIAKAQALREELLDEHRATVAELARGINADPDDLLGPAMPVNIKRPKRGKAA